MAIEGWLARSDLRLTFDGPIQGHARMLSKLFLLRSLRRNEHPDDANENPHRRTHRKRHTRAHTHANTHKHARAHTHEEEERRREKESPRGIVIKWSHASIRPMLARRMEHS